MTSTELAVVTEATAPVRLINAIERPMSAPFIEKVRRSHAAQLLMLLALAELTGSGYLAALASLWAFVGAGLFMLTAFVALSKVK